MKKIPLIGILTGIILIAMAFAGYYGSDVKSKTAFIPAVPGVLILLSCLVGLVKLKLGMHFAALFALLGFLAPLGRIIPTAIKGTFEFNFAGVMMILMGAICFVFLVLCVKSFIAVRRNKTK